MEEKGSAGSEILDPVAFVPLALVANCSGKKYSAERERWDIALGFIEILQSQECYSILFLAVA